MATVSEIREGIATNLKTIPGLRVFETIPDNVNPPAAIIGINSIEYHKAFADGLSTFSFTVTLVVGRASEREAQNKLDDYCVPTGARSIKAAIESDRTLNGVAFDSIITGMRNYGSITVSETTYLAAEFDLTVQAN